MTTNVPATEEPPVPQIELVRAGVERACGEFTSRISSFGFQRSKKMVWVRMNGNVGECVGFFRLGSSYGAPRDASVRIRMHIFIDRPLKIQGLVSDDLRDSGGYAYHLRFNAYSWSTYDRCMTDLVRVVAEHGLPWFESQRSKLATSQPPTQDVA